MSRLDSQRMMRIDLGLRRQETRLKWALPVSARLEFDGHIQTVIRNQRGLVTSLLLSSCIGNMIECRLKIA